MIITIVTVVCRSLSRDQIERKPSASQVDTADPSLFLSSYQTGILRVLLFILALFRCRYHSRPVLYARRSSGSPHFKRAPIIRSFIVLPLIPSEFHFRVTNVIINRYETRRFFHRSLKKKKKKTIVDVFYGSPATKSFCPQRRI